MNYYDLQFLHSLSQGIVEDVSNLISFQNIKYKRKKNEFVQEEQENEDQNLCIFILEKFYFAIKGNSIFRVAYANNSLEFINELRWTKFKGYGIDQSLYLKIKTFELQYNDCEVDNQCINSFQKILSLIWIDTTIEKLQAARLLYNHINAIQYQFSDKQICDIYTNLLKHVKQLKNQSSFKSKVKMMAENFIIFKLKEYQHFPEVKTNCNHCKVCKIHKSKYYCEGCYDKTGKKWSLCLDGCFTKFHQDPTRYCWSILSIIIQTLTFSKGFYL